MDVHVLKSQERIRTSLQNTWPHLVQTSSPQKLQFLAQPNYTVVCYCHHPARHGYFPFHQICSIGRRTSPAPYPYVREHVQVEINYHVHAL